MNKKHRDVGVNIGNGIGNIEDLPRAILEHILYFLPMKDAVRTSVLSKKWRYLWTSFPELVFDEKSYSNLKLFLNSVVSVILLRGHDHSPAPKKKFYLRCSILLIDSHIKGWITKIVEQKVQDFSLILSSVPVDFVLPHCLFSSHTLTSLCIDMPCILTLPSHINLPSLKSLHLKHVVFSNDNSIQQLFSHPALTELYITSCCWGYYRSISMSAPKLKILVISKDWGHRGTDGCQVVIHDCNLKLFSLFGQLLNEYSVSNSSMENAKLLKFYCEPTKPLGRSVSHLSKILQGLRDVQSLYLGDMAIAILKAGRGSPSWGLCLPIFHNVKSLTLRYISASTLAWILHATPNLQSLYLTSCLYGYRWEEYFENLPPCLFSSLRKVKIDLYDEDHLFGLHFLDCEAMVDQLEVRYYAASGITEEDLRRLLLNYTRKLTNCNITICDFW